MSSGRFPRKLAAILHADVAGYSRLTEQDEEGTHLRVQDYKRFLAEQVFEHDGHVVDSEGDSLLADFPSATDALICALAVQESLALRNRVLPAHRQVHFRIGINLSEVNVDTARQRLFGYGVTVAARLESLARPGGVCVSESVRATLPDTLPVELEYLGARAVKNITRPLRAFRASPAPEARSPPPQHRRPRTEAEAGAGLPDPGTATSLESPGPGESEPSGTRILPDRHGRTPIPSWATPEPRSFAQRLLTPLTHGTLQRARERITLDAHWRERVAEGLERAPSEAATVVHADFLRVWLRWNRRRFGPYRARSWKLFDFCLIHAFIYSSAFFFIGLIFLQGDTHIGELRVSWLEVGPAALPASPSGPTALPGEAGTTPLLLIVLALYAFADRLWRRYRSGHHRDDRQAFDFPRFVLWFLLSSAIGFALGLNGFGAGLVALSVAIGAIFLRRMPGSGLLYTITTAVVVLALNLVVTGAEAGDPTMSGIALALHGLIRDDVERFALLWLLFPVLNASFDTLSWRLSRLFGLALRLESPRSGKRAPTLSGYWWHALRWGLLDLAVALMLLLGVAVGLGASLELFDYFRRDHDGFYGLDGVVSGFVSDPLNQGFWLTGMLLTTLVPTSLHLFAVGSGLVGTLMRPAESGTRLSAVLMYGPAHPLFDHAARQAAWWRWTCAIRAAVLTGAWAALLVCLVLSVLDSGIVLTSLGNTLEVGQHFAAITIDVVH